MSAVNDIGALIDQTPGVCGGRPRIAGTGVSVRRIVLWDRHGLTPEEIVTQIPHLTLAQVHAALSFYHANRDHMEAAMAAEDAEIERLEQASGIHDHSPVERRIEFLNAWG
ncbi:MAG: DUF433 domain-containing protein [Planctomycetes bacterium]|nr:DUF433 domain-containing protein [Planctomycetota bacterium]